MAKIGRNDPCPCGSGKKYKQCCLRAERAGTQMTVDRMALRQASHWEVEAVAPPIGVDENPEARPILILIAAAGFVVHSNLLLRSESEDSDVAGWLADALEQAIEALDERPRAVLTNGPGVAEALHGQLSQLGMEIPVDHRPRLDEIDQFLAAMQESEGLGGIPRISVPVTWAAWGLPEAVVEEVFAAAAAFYRAAPWERLEERTFRAATSHGAWFALTIGAMGESFGLVLYEELGDLLQFALEDEPHDIFDMMEGRCLSLNLDPGHLLHKAMRREVARKGWEVADPRAYPVAHTIRFPGGGLPLHAAEDLIAILRTFPDLAERFVAGEELHWKHPETGVELIEIPGLFGSPDFDDDLDFPQTLLPGGPTGAGAEPEALVAALVPGEDAEMLFTDADGVLGAYIERLRGEGLAAATLRRHEDNIEELLSYLHGYRVPLRALHERHLRDFLYDYYPRKSYRTATRDRTLRGSIRRFFAFLKDEHALVFRFAERLLSDNVVFEGLCESSPIGAFWDDELVDWREWHFMQLEAHAMLPSLALGEDDDWGAAMGIVEAELKDELSRRWLIWREQAISEGLSDRQEVIEMLCDRQLAWETHPSHGRSSPLKAILKDRASRGDRFDCPF